VSEVSVFSHPDQHVSEISMGKSTLVFDAGRRRVEDKYGQFATIGRRGEEGEGGGQRENGAEPHAVRRGFLPSARRKSQSRGTRTAIGGGSHGLSMATTRRNGLRSHRRRRRRRRRRRHSSSPFLPFQTTLSFRHALLQHWAKYVHFVTAALGASDKESQRRKRPRRSHLRFRAKVKSIHSSLVTRYFFPPLLLRLPFRSAGGA